MTDKQRKEWIKALIEADAPFWLINKCVHRMQMGCEKYGEFDPDKDRRNLYLETEKELLDAINYMLMQNDKSVLTDLINLTITIREKR